MLVQKRYSYQTLCWLHINLTAVDSQRESRATAIVTDQRHRWTIRISELNVFTAKAAVLRAGHSAAVCWL